MTSTAKPANESIDYRLILIAHIVCADQQIHSEESKALYELAEQVYASKHTIEEIEKILAQDKNQISLEDSARRIQPSQQDETIRQVLSLAYIDGFFSPLEREMIERIAKIFGCSDRLQSIIEEAEEFRSNYPNDAENDPSELSFGAAFLKRTESILSRALVQKLVKIAPKDIGHKIEQLQREILLSGPEYDTVIQQCAAIASEDYKFAELSLNKTLEALNQLKKNIYKSLVNLQRQSKGNGKGESAKEITGQLEETRKALTAEIIKEVESLRESLKAKQRALKHFSIAFMGKTKAGKSTLHAIIAGGGWDAIGVGKQRTTRYNRVYEWKNIRIIDTPGIGAPDDGGRTDEEIAQSVIDESDVICYVVTNDSIQESEFGFLRILKEKAKPLTIILNVKNNLRDSRRLQNFLDNPNKLFTLEGKSGLGGHLERIRRYAQQHYSNDYFEIIPVMLLAAQMSREPKHANLKSQLFRMSKTQQFLDSIRISLLEYGTIRRSQTLLGSTVGIVEKPYNWVTKEVQTYQKLSRSLNDKRTTVRRKVEIASYDSLNYLENKIVTIFQDIINNTVTSFAKEHWKSDQSVMNRGWEKKLKDVRFSERINNAYEDAGEKFKKEVAEILEEIGRELQLVAELSGGNFKFGSYDTDGTLKFVMKIGGGILVLAGAFLTFVAPPLGIVMTLVGTVMGFIGNWFKSEEQKRREAADKIVNSLRSQLQTQQIEVINKAKDDYSKSCEQVAMEIEQYFAELISGVEAINRELEKSQLQMKDTANYLNRAYGKRIIDYCLKQYEPLTDNRIRQTIVRVQREFGRSIKIQTSLNISISEQLQVNLKRILQEDIIIQSTDTKLN